MRIDLHAHSDRSDGTMTPAELVHHGADVGIDVLALTDHDSFEGWEEAAKAAEQTGVTLVSGVEISCRYAGHGAHLLGYLPDPAYPPLLGELQRILDGRNARIPAVLERLRALGIPIDIDDVRRVAGPTAAVGRPHVADALVALGVVGDRGEAFTRYLSPGGPAFARRYATELSAMLGLVRRAGGVGVLAHPWAGRHDTSTLTAEAFAALQDAGLAGVEVDHEDHPPAVRERLRAVAEDLGLVVTGSSDFHGTGKVGHALGCNTTAPEEYDRLIALAAAASAASGRRTPEVVAP
jgi:3',5'-nucleoside bisphosphate phosphatase